MRRSLLWSPVLCVFLATMAWADARISVLVDVLKLPEAAQILSDEGLSHTEELNQDMLGGQGGAGWQVQVQRIYEPGMMVEMVRRDLEAGLDGDLLEEVIAFYASDLGAQIISLENSGRIAIQDPDVEEAARARYAELEDSGDPRLALISRYVDAGDMITRNVTSAMNSNYQFLRGLAEGNAIEMTEAEMLADVAGELDEITGDTTGWLYGYLLLAYHPLDEADLEAYVTFSESPAGMALNQALFNGFGKAYEDISYALGRAVALNMTAQEL